MNRVIFIFLLILCLLYGRKSYLIPLNQQIYIIRHATVKIIVRAEFEGIESNTISHGTYTDEGIVTHNHFVIPFDSAADGEVLIYDIDNNLLKTLSFTAVTVVKSCFQTIVLDIGELPLYPAATTNRITTDNILTIDWINKETVIKQSNIRRRFFNHVTFDYTVKHGSSGGGVFQNGRLIGNIWQVDRNKTTMAIVCS